MRQKTIKQWKRCKPKKCKHWWCSWNSFVPLIIWLPTQFYLVTSNRIKVYIWFWHKILDIQNIQNIIILLRFFGFYYLLDKLSLGNFNICLIICKNLEENLIATINWRVWWLLGCHCVCSIFGHRKRSA